MNKQDRMSKFIPDNTIFVRYFFYIMIIMLSIQFVGIIFNYILG